MLRCVPFPENEVGQAAEHQRSLKQQRRNPPSWQMDGFTVCLAYHILELRHMESMTELLASDLSIFTVALLYPTTLYSWSSGTSIARLWSSELRLCLAIGKAANR